MAASVKRISTHVLDTSRGLPAANMEVRLQRQQSPGRWLDLASSRTDKDGRCAQLFPEGQAFREGTYRLIFQTAPYYIGQKTKGLYPVIEITFQVRAGESHLHIPLLLSPNGYTTYRGT